ncbi:hypothetical protein [Nonomuraea helvata]|uniref:WD40 repeat domain-containing protein n=1 Tax=Nonomuraea helvata TaxID=37484 RepID=A0ABV5SIV0_9ACTN
MRGEQDLIRTLRTAADRVERLDLVAGVAARRRVRRTRQRMRVLLAAAAVVAVAGGTTAALSGENQRAQPAVTPSAPRYTSAAALWPNAVAKVPARTAEGWKIHPVTALSATEVLMLAPAQALGQPSRLEVYDMARKTTRVLGQVPGIKKMTAPAGLAVGSRYFAWYGPRFGKPTHFWIMPRSGGTAVHVAQTTANVDSVGLTEDSLVWSLQDSGGVYRVPLTGGAPSRLTGSDGLHLIAWPWAAGYDSDAPTRNHNRIVNLETRQSFDVRVPKKARLTQCTSQWCTGELKGRMFVQRADGAGRKILPAELKPYSPRLLVGDRYALAWLGEDRAPLDVLYDMSTGAMAGLGERLPGTQVTPVTDGLLTSAPSTTLFWNQDAPPRESGKSPWDAKEWTVLNLLAVRR